MVEFYLWKICVSPVNNLKARDNTTPGLQLAQLLIAEPTVVVVKTQALLDGYRDRLAQFYVDMAQGMFPVIEISAGRPIDFVVIRGRELQLQTRAGR